MTATKQWRVDIYVGEREGRTHAEARLFPGRTATLTATGSARLNPTDSDVPEIGDELAVARALANLAHELLEASAGDIEALTERPAHLTR